MTCMACGGTGCSECGNIGSVDIVQCPLEIITADVWELLEYAELYKKGLPPVAGGALDQAKIFTESCRYVFEIESYVRNKLGIIG